MLKIVASNVIQPVKGTEKTPMPTSNSTAPQGTSLLLLVVFFHVFNLNRQ